MEKENNSRRRAKKPRQNWKPHWALRILHGAWLACFGAVKIALGALATVVMIVLVCGFVFVGILGDYLEEDVLPEAANYEFNIADQEKTSYAYYVDRNGDLILVDMGELYRKEDVERFVEENDIRFSLAFGPILIEDGRVVAKHYYALGETDDFYSRAALCQMGPLHYMLVTVNRRGQDVTRFAKHLQEMGAITAYALDGGQTSTIVTGNKLINPVDYGGERETSDIIYFATAVPDGG